MDRLTGIQTKIKRAKSHIQDFETARTNFFAHDPYVIATKRNPETRQLAYYLVSVEEVPPLLGAIAGDAIQNLRSALDHLAYQLVVVGRGTSEPPEHPERISFPIFNSAEEYEAEKLRKVEGAAEDAIKAIDSVKPYKGGNDVLWQLHRLNIVDKHRLMLTVGSNFRSVDIGSYMSRMIRNAFPDTEFPTVPAFLQPADRMCPLKTGDVLFIDAPDAEPNKDMKFVFDIALSEPQIMECESLLETLNNMANLVESLIPPFERFLA
jgi:hypothetical protein